VSSFFGVLRKSCLIADKHRLRRRDENEWMSSANQSSTGPSSRSIPDHDGRRRSYRARHSVSRTVTQPTIRANGPSATRSNRNAATQSGPMRTPIHSSTPSFDENSTAGQRSITPHPTNTGQSIWLSPSVTEVPISDRPSSLPTERSPLGEGSEGVRTTTGNNTMSNSLRDRALDREWLRNQVTSGNMSQNWMMPSTLNGRPASATFHNELPHMRLQQLQDGLNVLHNHTRQPPPYQSTSSEAEFDPRTGGFIRR
jgi:hypothetical protein